MGTLLITVNDIKTLTPVPRNVDDSKLLADMRYGQDVILEKVLHVKLLGELITAKDADTLTANQTTLIDTFIVPYMAYLVYWLALPSLWATISNTGIQTKSGEDFTAISKSDLHVFRKDAESRYNEYQERLLCYLCDNEDLFPSHRDLENCERPITTSEPSSFVFRKNVRRFRSEFDDNNDH